MIDNRLRWVLEKCGLFTSPKPVSVRDGALMINRNVCFKVFMNVVKTGLMLFNFSRVYDQVWCDGLL